MIYIRLVLLISIISYCSAIFAQGKEFSLTALGINSLNVHTKNSSAGGSLRTFWSPTYSLSLGYTSSFLKSNLLFSGKFGVYGMYNQVSINYNLQSCETCDPKKKISSSSGDLDFGIQLSVGKRFYTKTKNEIDLFGGFLIRRTAEGFKGARPLICNDAICTKLLFNQRYTIKGWIHPGIFVETSWPFYTSKSKDLKIRLVLTYVQGVLPVYKFSSYLKLVPENIEYNYELKNNGSFFGIGFSFCSIKNARDKPRG